MITELQLSQLGMFKWQSDGAPVELGENLSGVQQVHWFGHKSSKKNNFDCHRTELSAECPDRFEEDVEGEVGEANMSRTQGR